MSEIALDFVRVAPDEQRARAAFEAYVAELAELFPDGFDAQTAADPDVTVLALRDEAVVGSGSLVSIDDDVDEVKRMWVSSEARGARVGSRLLAELERLAVERGNRTARLDTHGSLTAAVAMYERHGYRRIERYNDNPYAQLFFEKTLT